MGIINLNFVRYVSSFSKKEQIEEWS